MVGAPDQRLWSNRESCAPPKDVQVIEIEIVPEDWGWCVILQRKPNLIWVGCSGQKGVEFSTDYFEEGEEGITWNCFMVMEAPFIKKFLGSGNSTEAFVRIREYLVDQLSVNQDICFVKESW